MKLLASLLLLILSASTHADIGQLKLEFIQAKRGDASAQFRIASAYEFGTDIKKDLDKSLEWYRKAAAKSHALSQFKIGYFYEFGIAVTRDIDTAIYWYKKAKKNGSKQAAQRLIKAKLRKKKISNYSKDLIREKKVDATRKIALAKRIAKNNAIIKEKKRAQARKTAQNKKIAAAKRTAQAHKIAKSKTTKPHAVTKKSRKKYIDVKKVVLNNKWKNAHGAADYFPSTSTTCLGTGKNEFTCFSDNKKRNLNGVDVTYTTKSIINGFKSNGNFNILYNYNGINISDQQKSVSDIYGLTTKTGWQPTLKVKCKMINEKTVLCSRGNKKIKFYY